MSSMMKPQHLIQEMAIAVATKYWNINCNSCRHFKSYTTHYNYKGFIVIGKCDKLKTLVYKNYTPKCGRILYEEK